MLLLFALIAGSSSVWATDAVYKTLTFTSNDGTKVNGYEDSWTETADEFSWTIENFNNNNWGWNATKEGASKLIKCGRKRTGKSGSYVYTPSVATITTAATMSEAITKVVVTLEAINKDDINSIKLYVASNSSFTDDLQTISATVPSSAGDLTIEVETPTENMYYKLEFDTKGQSTSNGHTSVSMVKYCYEDIPAFTISASANNAIMGGVSVSGSVITASPNAGYRVKAGDAGYTVSTGTATVVNNGDNTFTVTPTSNCLITINFEAIPTHQVKWSVNGAIIDTEDVYEGAAISFDAPGSGVPSGYVYRGWSASEILTPQASAPDYVTSATCTSDITYYAVIAISSVGAPESTLTQTLTYNTSDAYPWNIGGSTTDKSSYTLFHTGGYVKSASFDLSKLNQVKVYGGTFGGSDYKTFTIGDGTNIWKSGELTGTNNAREHSFTGGTALSGTGELYITSTCGTSDNSGIRISKVEIFTMEPKVTYSNFCTTVPTHIDITITAAGWASFSNACEVAIPDGVTAYYAQKKDESNITLKEITGGYIPANTGVVVSGSANTYEANITTTGATLAGENILYPWLNAGTPSAGTYYTLAVNGGNPVFKKSTGGTLAAGKAYLVLPTTAPELNVNFGETTGINEVRGQMEEVRGEHYNLAGQRVAQPTKGLYIVNGKKVILK